MEDKTTTERPWYDLSTMKRIYESGEAVSDEEAAEFFRDLGFEVARRTISRARNDLGIPRLSERLNKDLMSLPGEIPEYKSRPKTAPTGMTPGIKIEGDKQVLTTNLMPAGDIDWDEQIAEWGLDPKEWTIAGDTVKFSVWEQRGREESEPVKLWSWRGELRRKGAQVSGEISQEEYDELLNEVRGWEYSNAHEKDPEGDYVFVVCLADWQAGKGDGEGTAGTVARILALTDDLVAQIHGLRSLGYKIDRIHLQGLGDLVENCLGHYSMQSFTVELDRRQQTRLIRRLLLGIIKAMAPLARVVSVGTVPGNHGENRNSDGKQFTNLGDNDDVAIFEQVAEICTESDALQNVVFSIPDNELVQTFDMNGTIIAFAHAHQAVRNRQGGKLPPAQAKVLTWWNDQAFAGTPVGDADILVTGHYHHFSIIEHGRKVHMQCPAMDSGSDWFRNITGQDSRPGTLTFLAGKGTYKAVEILGTKFKEKVND